MTFTVPDEVARRLEAAAAAARGVIERAELPELSFTGIGAGRPDLAERHYEILAEHLRDVA